MNVRKKNKDRRPFLKEHSLSLVVGVFLAVWIILYVSSNETRHLGAFFGNAIADWTGILVMVILTKFFHEKGSKESTPAHARKPKSPVMCFFRDHSLTLFLILTGCAWLALYIRMDPQSKWGQVVGNILSEWTQIFCLVLFTKRLIERGSKES